MHTPTLLLALSTATALALPRPQAFWTGIPSVYLPSPYPGCTGGMPCPEWYIRKQEREAAQRKQGLHVRQGAPEAVDDAVDKDGEDEGEAGIFYCRDTHWGGECVHRVSPLGSAPGDCTMLSLEASSVGPDLGFYCVFYTNAVCAPLAADGADSLTLSYPGTDDLGTTEKGDFNDRLLSYQCFREERVSVSGIVVS